MNQAWNSFLQTVFQFVKALFTNVSKKMHRDAVVLTVGISVVTVVTFTAGDFQGGGKNALVAFAETQEETETETDLEEADEIASAAEEETSQKEETDSTDTSGFAEDMEQEGEDTEDPEEAKEPESEDTEDSEEAREPEEATESVEEDQDDTEISLSDRYYKVLLKIVQAEAGNCDKKGRILVANVILNRVESDEFPDTVAGVVYERNQFSPVIDGSIDRCKVADETIEAVECALAGEDYSEGALYFMNRRTSSGKNVRWFDNHLDYLFKHGSHEFFK